MAEAVAWAVAYLSEGEIILTATEMLVVNTAIVASSMAYGASEQRKMQAMSRDAYNASQVDRLATVNSTVAARELVLGRTRKAGTIFYKASTGTNQQTLYFAIALAGHEIDAVETIYLNDVAVTIDGSGNVLTAPYSVANTVVTDYQVVGAGGTITLPASYVVGSVSYATWGQEFNYGPPAIVGLVASAPVGSTITYQYLYTPESAVKITTYLGAVGQTVNTDLNSAFPTDWGTNNVVQGVAYLVVKLTYSDTAFPSGVPAVTAVIRGAKLYDPRSGLTVWSENPALMMRHIYAHPKFGNATVSAAEDVRFVAAANACDSAVVYTVGGVAQPSRAKYKASLVVPFGGAAVDALNSLAQSMAGVWAFAGGEFYLKAGVFTASVMSLTEADLAIVQRNGAQESQRQIAITVHRERAKKFNTVKAKIWDVGQDYKEVSIAPLAPSALVTADGVELVQEISMPAVGYAPQAQHISGIILRDARDPLTVDMAFKLRAYPLELFDTVDLTLARYGWTNKLFMVNRRVWNTDGTLQLGLKEISASTFTMDGNFSAQGFAANTNLPSPWIVANLGTITVTSGTSELLKQSDGTIVSRMRVSWPQISDMAVRESGSIEVQYKIAGLDTPWAILMVDGADTQVITGDVQDREIYIVRARGKTSLGVGNWCTQVQLKVVGKTQAPSNVASIGYTTEQFGIRLNWPNIADFDVDLYELRTSLVGVTTWDGATLLTQTKNSEYLWQIQAAGTYKVWVKAIDTSGNYSASAAFASVVVTAALGPVVSWALSGPDEVLTWTIPASLFPIDRYEIRVGASWAAGTLVASTKQTSYAQKVNYIGPLTYWVAAVDSSGTLALPNYGAAGSTTNSINIPSSVVGGRAEIVDNNVLLFWNAPALGLGQLPIDRYEVRKGVSWAAGTVVGSNGNSTFASVFEQAAGTYNYWIAAWDTSGVVTSYSVGSPIVATVTQPPDYVLRNDYNSAFPGTVVNMYPEGGKLVGPMDTTQTFATHFTSRGWTTPQNQIDAGYPVYANPSATSGSYEEIIDYGAAIPSTVITATLSTTVVTGSVSVTCTISWKLLAGDAWTVLTAGVTSALLPQFRYIRVQYALSCTAGANLLQFNTLNIKLAVKLRNDSGSGIVTVAGSGSAVTFGYPFVSADTPIVQPNGATPLIPVVVYTGGVNPTGFTVYLYTTAGAQTTGSFSWTVRGY
jgi:hypothetical protein